jgi:hypothetical protein
MAVKERMPGSASAWHSTMSNLRGTISSVLSDRGKSSVPADRITIKIGELQNAFLFADIRGQGMDVEVYIRRSTGKFFFRSDDTEDDDFPENAASSPDYLAVPDKRDLDLGRNLVLLFAEEKMPEFADEISDFFRRSGAYRRFRDLLGRTNKLDAWHAFENEATLKALTDWAEEQGFRVE